MVKKIKEEDNIHKEWYKEVKKINTPEEAKKFIEHLINDYGHDYGTIVHACSVAAIAGFRAINGSKQGGITGFQEGCIGWQMMEEFMNIKGPAKILDYKNMLYPQYHQKFEKIISPETWEHLQKEAKKNLEKREDSKLEACQEVKDHWKSIVAGEVPFGYRVVEGA